MTPDLVTFWQAFVDGKPPHVHPDDRVQLDLPGNARHVAREPMDFAAFVRSPLFGDPSDSRMHLSLLPQPYAGDLARADIVILLLNPGFAHCDYYAESHMSAFRQRLWSTLHQDFAGIDYPFYWLDPCLCWHAGYAWWERKLRGVIQQIARERFGGRYLDAARHLSQRLAQIELVAYHSPTFKSHKLIDDLASTRAARTFVRDTLVPAALDGERTVIATRQAAAWGLPEPTGTLVIYRGGLTRGAGLGPGTPGGEAILQRVKSTPRAT